MSEKNAVTQVKEDAVAKQPVTERAGDEKLQKPHPLFIKREKPNLAQEGQESKPFEINPDSVKELILPLSEQFRGVEISVVGSAAADSEKLGRAPRDIDLIIFTEDPSNADAMYDAKEALENVFKKNGVEVDVFPFPGIDPRKPHITIQDGKVLSEDSLGDESYFTDRGGANKPVNELFENKDSQPEKIVSANTVEELPNNKVKITRPDGSYVIGKREEDGSVKLDKMSVPKGVDRGSARLALRDALTDHARESGSSNVSGSMTRQDSLRENVKLYGDSVTFRDPETGDEIGVSRAAEKISNGEKVDYTVDIKSEMPPEDQKVPSDVRAAREALAIRDFEAFDQLIEKIGPDSAWSEKLQREGISAGAKVHDVSPDMVNNRNRLRREAEEWEKQKKEEEQYREKHPIRSRVQDIRDTVNKGRSDTKIGKENPHTRWLERYHEQSTNWQEGDTDWPTPPETIPDDYIHPADAHYNTGGPEPEPGIWHDEAGNPFYVDPETHDTGGWAPGHTPGDPSRPENSKGMARRMPEISNVEWQREGVQGLQRRDAMKELVREIARQVQQENEEELKERKRTEKKERERQEREKREREAEKKKTEGKKKSEEDETRPKTKPNETDEKDISPLKKDEDTDSDEKPRDDNEKRSPDTKKDLQRDEESQNETTGPRRDRTDPKSESPEMPPIDDVEDLLKEPGFIDRVREKMQQRREERAKHREGFEPVPRGPGIGERVGASLREKLDKWIEKHAQELQNEMQDRGSGDVGNMDPDSSRDITPRNNQNRNFPSPSQLREQINRMSASELRDALQRAAQGSGNVDRFMQTPVGNTGRTLGDYYRQIESDASRERGEEPGNYRGPMEMSQKDITDVSDTIGVTTPTSSESPVRASDPDLSAPTDRDTAAMDNIREIISHPPSEE